MAKIRLKYNPRRLANDRYVGAWYVFMRGWVGPFRTARGAAFRDIFEEPDNEIT